MAIRLRFLLAALAAAFLGLAPLGSSGLRADAPGALKVSIAFLHEQVPEPIPLSLVEPVATDLGLAGARLAITDNNTTGRFLNQQYELKEVLVPAGGDLAGAVKSLIAGGTTLIVADLPAKRLLEVADLPEAKGAVILNTGAQDDSLRIQDCRANVFHVIPSRAMKADALAQYEGLYGEDAVKHVCCSAHARRKFVAASEGNDERATKALELFGRLYAIERKLPPLLSPSENPVTQDQRLLREEQRRAIRQREAEPVWNELEKWLAEQKPGALPKSPLGVAIGYTTNNGAALKRYLERGFLALDNNLSERTLRAIALGRNAWGVIGSEVGGKTAAILYSAVGTCKHLGIDPLGYLREALPGLFTLGEKPTTGQLLDWLPDRRLLNRSRDRPRLQGNTL